MLGGIKMKKWKCRVNILFGAEFVDVIVKANTERKAKKFAEEKIKKKYHQEHPDTNSVFVEICSCELISET